MVHGRYLHGTASDARFMVLLTQETRLQHIPSPLTFEEACALCVPYHTAHRALFVRLNVRPGRTIL